MGKLKLASAGLIAGLAACSGGEANNSVNGANELVEEGDLNMAIGGDELSPIPEAEDDLAANMANQSAPGNGAAASNQAAPANSAAPAPPR